MGMSGGALKLEYRFVLLGESCCMHAGSLLALANHEYLNVILLYAKNSIKTLFYINIFSYRTCLLQLCH